MSTDDRLEIRALDSISDEFVEALHTMIPQLAPGTPLPGREQLEAVIRCSGNTLLAARVNGRTVGTLTLTMLTTPTGITGWIADVVVDGLIRGKGIGEKLVREAIGIAESKGARYVDLSSRPAREAANRLYQRIGFEKRETNYYRYRLRDK
jgi:ribosomal protein S18 acetylase RimI-like enzyme